MATLKYKKPDGTWGLVYSSANSNAVHSHIVLIDSVNGFDYIVQVQNGQLVSFCACNGIEISTMPTKVNYTEGEAFDPTGMVVVAVCPDGTSREVTTYTYPEVASSENIITYVENGKTYTATVSVTIA